MKLLFLMTLIFSVACSSGKCRQKKDNKDFIQQVSNLPEFKNKKTKDLTYSDLSLVQVYVPDGSKQCVSGSQQQVDGFKAKLETNKIRIIRVQHLSDGVMRTQVCGSPTGRIYVFDIQQLDLEKALSLGFQKK